MVRAWVVLNLLKVYNNFFFFFIFVTNELAISSTNSCINSTSSSSFIISKQATCNQSSFKNDINLNKSFTTFENLQLTHVLTQHHLQVLSFQNKQHVIKVH